MELAIFSLNRLEQHAEPSHLVLEMLVGGKPFWLRSRSRSRKRPRVLEVEPGLLLILKAVHDMHLSSLLQRLDAGQRFTSSRRAGALHSTS
jgi:hypothetical protein